MVRYLSLIQFTDQGIRDLSKSIQRADDFRAAVEDQGGKVIAQYWALGNVDGCVVFESPDDTTAASLLLQLGQKDKVRTTTTRVFDAQEFADILKHAST